MSFGTVLKLNLTGEHGAGALIPSVPVGHTRHFGYFRSLSRRFPYAIYYKLSAEGIEIWRVYRYKALRAFCFVRYLYRII